MSSDPARPVITPWNTRDIVFVATISVAFGVFFWALGAAWSGLAFLGPALNLLYALWLLPALVAPLVVRRAGAALFAEIVAAGLSAILGSQWGADVLLSGLLQGAGAELVFLLTGYRNFRAPVLALAGVGSMALAFAHDWFIYYRAVDAGTVLAIGAAMLVSALTLLPFAALSLVGALHAAGVLERYQTTTKG